ncbi:hypothetical protein [uncultured Citricoccus sp.]|uniref:hypothetical protein n=1 Tax=uncultured Citricoccus sp. TaxID=614031 RepID=UPI00263584F1|nr:hypothetical protein [uncultured Citricoccus sp.]
MTGLEGAGIAGALLSWIGLGLGLPLFPIGLALRSAEPALVPIEVVIVRGPHEPLAHWSAGDDFHEQPLHPTERAHYAGRDVCTGYIDSENPSQMRLDPHRQATGTCRALGISFLVIGLVGFAISLVPMLLD